MKDAKKLYDVNGHVVKVPCAPKRLSNGELAVCLQCCANPGTDHWVTLNDISSHTPATIDAALTKAAARVAKQHAAMEAADKYIRDTYDAPKVVEPVPTMKHLD